VACENKLIAEVVDSCRLETDAAAGDDDDDDVTSENTITGSFARISISHIHTSARRVLGQGWKIS